MLEGEGRGGEGLDWIGLEGEGRRGEERGGEGLDWIGLEGEGRRGEERGGVYVASNPGLPLPDFISQWRKLPDFSPGFKARVYAIFTTRLDSESGHRSEEDMNLITAKVEHSLSKWPPFC